MDTWIEVTLFAVLLVTLVILSGVLGYLAGRATRRGS